MDNKQTKESQAINWEYLPDTTTLSQYLGRKELIELSKCCKRYRNQLNRKILEYLNLVIWDSDNDEISNEDNYNIKYEIVLRLLKIDLGNRLKLVKGVNLDCFINPSFSKRLIKLIPNIKLLRFINNSSDSNLFNILTTVLKGFEQLEHVEFVYDSELLGNNYARKQIFQKSIKSIKINFDGYYIPIADGLTIYDTIDSSYINLQSLSIITNRTLQNLSCGMQNLREVEIIDTGNLDTSTLVTFLITNPQLKKLITTNLEYKDEEIVKTVLCSKYIESWCINDRDGNESVTRNLPSNYSIKYLKLDSRIFTPLALKIINACKSLETLEFNPNNNLNNLNLSKFNQRVNILKLFNVYRYYPGFEKIIKKIDSLKLFNQVHVSYSCEGDEVVYEEYSFDLLKNYKIITITSGVGIFKLIS
ncbi:hypothetical protein CONCODRAFT_10882 [Conidiobolus coronatus NRRL 28638]|uniref:F-box domain-containing protein n=1 Tax=Conidiobolus coronatus (strain ATCC 28846 / CBS 209.66 / NRRL 28638) TaxID=796925 RepID=A0A137NWC7_CONC2|nr:hypothetical protein CONCODRAFT_10882 [Conidiobolus coronatus NRRL 28638]|eukprot:KXN67113.1 hypothetical protein CONCODRAFT_10882 [Conidiobolus coronatus NRRL 28638]